MAHEIIYKILQVKLNKNLLDIPTYSGQNAVIIKRIARLKLLKAVLHAKNRSLWNAPTVTYWNIFCKYEKVKIKSCLPILGRFKLILIITESEQ